MRGLKTSIDTVVLLRWNVAGVSGGCAGTSRGSLAARHAELQRYDDQQSYRFVSRIVCFVVHVLGSHYEDRAEAFPGLERRIIRLLPPVLSGWKVKRVVYGHGIIHLRINTCTWGLTPS